MRPVTATYRLQFGEGMTFADAARLAPYLAKLGVSHLYASPIFEARSGSTHGYDVTDYNRLRESLGGRAGFDAMVEALHEHGLGLILDIVPNHMAASVENPWLADVMAKGRASPHADAFDIDWERGDGKLVLPILGAPLDEVLASGDIAVRDGQLFVYDTGLPLADGTGEGTARDVLAAQHYDLVFWRDLHRLNYRRFFDITDLIGVRMEDEGVFARSHALLAELIEAGAVDGVRVDHVDGMRDPEGYLARLAGLFPDQEQPPVWVEKIVEGEERLPPAWPVRGETGYAVMPWLDGVFVNTEAEAAFTDLYRALTGDERAFHAVENAAKREVIAGPFAHEFETLSERVGEAAGVPADDARAVIETVARSFPVYRTYLPAEGEAARLRAYAAPAESLPGFDAVLRILADPARPEALTFQQMTGPVTAKAVEDTSFYRWHRWSMLNEVGGDPSVFGRTSEAFHARMAERARTEPFALSATATHDTKRGEDVRARLAAATHEPDFWAQQARAWWAASEAAREGVAPVTAYLLFQTAVGFWDEGAAGELADRLSEYVLKAARERKRDTSWTDQDEAYEERLTALARAACEGRLGEIAAQTAARFGAAGQGIAVARTVLKATIPGVPDTYQGREATDLFLVDPDNRRPVDFGGLSRELAASAPPKLAATAAMLRLRRDHPDLFAGSYEPRQTGPGTLAFTRRAAGQGLHVAVATRPGAALPDLPGESIFDGTTARVALER